MSSIPKNIYTSGVYEVIDNYGYFYFYNNDNNEQATHTFTSFYSELKNVDILCVGGGGAGGLSGGGFGSGGGGAGLMATIDNTTIENKVEYTIKVGNAGLARDWVSQSGNGYESSISKNDEIIISAPGGGRGQDQKGSVNGGDSPFYGSSGGGSGRSNAQSPGNFTPTPDTVIKYFGNGGGNGHTENSTVSGADQAGGGGAGSKGAAAFTIKYFKLYAPEPAPINDPIEITQGYYNNNNVNTINTIPNFSFDNTQSSVQYNKFYIELINKETLSYVCFVDNGTEKQYFKITSISNSGEMNADNLTTNINDANEFQVLSYYQFSNLSTPPFYYTDLTIHNDEYWLTTKITNANYFIKINFAFVPPRIGVVDYSQATGEYQNNKRADEMQSWNINGLPITPSQVDRTINMTSFVNIPFDIDLNNFNASNKFNNTTIYAASGKGTMTISNKINYVVPETNYVSTKDLLTFFVPIIKDGSSLLIQLNIRIINPPIRIESLPQNPLYADVGKTMKIKQYNNYYLPQKIIIAKSDFSPTITIPKNLDLAKYGSIEIKKTGSSSYNIIFQGTSLFSQLNGGLYFLINIFNLVNNVYEAKKQLIYVVDATKFTYPNNKPNDISI